MLAFNKENIQNLEILRLAQKLRQSGFIAQDADLSALEEKSTLYHPGLFMRVFLFIAGYVGGSAAIGLWFYIWKDNLDEYWRFVSLIAGIGLLVFLEAVLIRTQNHFKSGITEVVLYGALALIAMGIAADTGADDWVALLIVVLLCVLAAIRYTDAFLSALALVLLAVVFLFFVEDERLGLARVLLPFFVMVFFTGMYIIFLRFEKRWLAAWAKPIYAAQAISLILTYLGGNYLVVRELNAQLSGEVVRLGEDIPMAWLFYGLTILMPILYVFMGIKNRDRIRLWVGMLTTGFSVFTFKYYYSFGHPEVTLTIAGLFVLAFSVFVLNRLKTPKAGFTRNRLASANLDYLTAEGILISQTLGGTTNTQQAETFKGGQFGGGGASGNF